MMIRLNPSMKTGVNLRQVHHLSQPMLRRRDHDVEAHVMVKNAAKSHRCHQLEVKNQTLQLYKYENSNIVYF